MNADIMKTKILYLMKYEQRHLRSHKVAILSQNNKILKYISLFKKTLYDFFFILKSFI